MLAGRWLEALDPHTVDRLSKIVGRGRVGTINRFRGVPGGWVSRSGVLDARGFEVRGCPRGLGQAGRWPGGGLGGSRRVGFLGNSGHLILAA